MSNKLTYYFYWNGPFSQWQKSAFEMDGVSFGTAEQAMMYHKALLFGDADCAKKILASDDPGKQKALGRQVVRFDEAIWDDNKVRIVLDINRAKFDQNKGLRRKLFQTGMAEMVEASPLDNIWAIGLDAETAKKTKPTEWPGQNLLGKIVTQVKYELAKKYPNEYTACAPSQQEGN